METDEYILEDMKTRTLLILALSYANQDDSFFGGNFVKNQVHALKGYFKKIIVIAPVLRSFGYLEKEKLCTDYIDDNVEVYFPRCWYIPVFWRSKIPIGNRQKVVENTIKHHRIHFDLIHAHFTWPSGYIGVMLKKEHGIPLVTTIHENSRLFDQEVRISNPLINRAWSDADALIRVNRKDIPVLKHYNERVFSIPNGFSSSFHRIDTMVARERLGLPQEVKILFTLGVLIKRKGFNFLIDAMEQICRHREDVLCYIGGAGEEKDNLQRQINKLQLGEKVHLLGLVPNDDLPLWMNACDLFVLPSLGEGNPTVMFEALGCGKPFIGTRVGGVPEIITSEVYGLLVEPADASDLAEKITMALNREWDREKILVYAQQFTWENIAKNIVDVYALVLESNAGHEVKPER